MIDPPPISESLYRQAAIGELLVLIALAESGPGGFCGLDLTTLVSEAGMDLSDGTVYPLLHAVADDGLAERHDGVTRKLYTVDDAAAVDDRLSEFEASLEAWLSLIQAAREDLPNA